MRYTDQKKFIENLRRFEKEFDEIELKEYKMFVKRHKDGEDLDNISFKKLSVLNTKYYGAREKPDINELFKKK
jgi:hypothetical protein